MCSSAPLFRRSASNEQRNNARHLETPRDSRHYQIRVHLSHHKLPIIGDRTYNPRNAIAKDTPKEILPIIQHFPRQALHASKIGFELMGTEEKIQFEQSPPEDMSTLISTLERV